MEGICVRCARLSLRRGIIQRHVKSGSLNKSFSSATRLSEDPKATPSKPVEEQRPFKITRQPIASRPQQRSGPSQQTPTSTSPPSGGQVLRRSGPSQGQYSRRTGSAPQPGQILRRAGGDQVRTGQYTRRPGQQATPGRSNDPKSRRPRQPGNRARASQSGSSPPTEAELEDYVTKYIDPPENPTEAIEYHPAPQSMLELQKDWPDTPLSATGLTATLVQKIEYLARRIPHGYQTPEQIAEHFRKGNLTRFESEEEKQQVLKIAQELAAKRAGQLSERKGEQIAPADMTFVDLSKNDNDKKALVGDIIKGDIAEADRQRMPFLDSIVRNLRNNETYNKVEMDKFMARVQSVMPAQGANKRAPKARQ